MQHLEREFLFALEVSVELHHNRVVAHVDHVLRIDVYRIVAPGRKLDAGVFDHEARDHRRTDVIVLARSLVIELARIGLERNFDAARINRLDLERCGLLADVSGNSFPGVKN